MDGKHADGQYSEGRLTNWSRGSSWRPGPQQQALASLEEVAPSILPSQSPFTVYGRHSVANAFVHN